MRKKRDRVSIQVIAERMATQHLSVGYILVSGVVSS